MLCRFRKKKNISIPRKNWRPCWSGYLGGRAAEEIVFDTVTTGAANDIEQATKRCKSHDHPVWYV